ncbi:helix-turn-helix transcriptional regulator [Streptomyces sp. MST-110588]|uniref:helix-turn-helix transcriptional regulator n=1 Tax=Streptomyces sp. MST-110588 TaxID=2833628 RepID=UPI001F5D112D|nr:helix-turn-helix transcriptional regulator [Streptomyces sp. MST-110588]UNO39677.1 helix-turn-helix transcriptional regulator [Streptomyces sp. MST-110588]
MRTSPHLLGRLGVDPLTESVYRAMLAHPEDSPEAVRDRLALTGEELRAATGRLADLALVRPSAEDPRKLYAVSPRLGMDMLLGRQQAELAAQQQRVEESRAAAARLISEFAVQYRAAPDNGPALLAGADRIGDGMTELGDKTVEEFHLLAAGRDRERGRESGRESGRNNGWENGRNNGRESGPGSADLPVPRSLYERMLGRGVTVRTVRLDSSRHDQEAVAHARWLASIGGQVRTTAALPTRMALFDRRTAIVSSGGTEPARTAVVVRVPGVVSALCALFDGIWANADRFGPPPRRDAGAFTPQQIAALRLLADGHTDATVARHLGVSARTARRLATEAMAGMKARSRFQAGVLAVRLGHLPASSP